MFLFSAVIIPSNIAILTVNTASWQNIVLWWPIYTIMNSSSFINTNPIHSRRDFFPAVEPDSFQTDTSTCCTDTLILYIFSVLQYTCSIYFLFFHVFFLTPNRPQQLGDKGFVRITGIKNGTPLKHWQTCFCKKTNMKSQPVKNN